MRIHASIAADAEKYGERWASLFHEYCYWLLVQCRLLKVDSIYFLAREGIFFHEIANKLNDKFHLVKADLKVLELSRLSTYLPSISMDAQHAFQRMWNIYPNQSAQSFFLSLGLDSSAMKKLYEEFGGSYIRKIPKIAEDISFRKFLDIPKVRDKIALGIKESRYRLNAYLAQNGFLNHGKIALIDVGWRGSIQDNLSILYPDKNIVGFYLGLHQFQWQCLPSNSCKRAFLFDANTP